MSGWELLLRLVLLGSKSHRSLGILEKFLLMDAQNQGERESLSFIQSGNIIGISTLDDRTHTHLEAPWPYVCDTISQRLPTPPASQEILIHGHGQSRVGQDMAVISLDSWSNGTMSDITMTTR